jgi:hypothetical protein
MSYPSSNAIVPAVNTAERPSQARHPQVYQIDFTAVASGKRIASTKRRVRWYVLCAIIFEILKRHIPGVFVDVATRDSVKREGCSRRQET